MALGLEDKKAIVAEVNETASSALSLVIADARGCTVDEMTGLRKALVKTAYTSCCKKYAGKTCDRRY